MPNLSELTDFDPSLSVPVDADGIRRVYINGSSPAIAPSMATPVTDDRPEPRPEPLPDVGEALIGGTTGHRDLEKIAEAADNLIGRNNQERYQLWPEKMIRSGFTLPHDVMTGEISINKVDPDTGDVYINPDIIGRILDMAGLAGTGGLAGTTDGTLGSTPFLRPALKYKDKLYKGKEGQQHMDVIPENLYPDFQKKALSGEDINDYNFGFHNDKGQFLTREKALEYGIDTGLIDPQAGKFGALTSTLLADSSKPGAAIESVAKSQAPTFYSALEHNVNQIGQSKMTGEQWLGTLSNKPGVKPEELDWTGLKSFLEENKGKPVTKEQVQEHLQNNKVELKEVNKADKVAIDPVIKYLHESMGPATKHIVDAASIADARKFNSHFRETTKGMSDEEVLSAARASEKLEGLGDTKYHSYQLPGGENYREMLMTLPKENNLAKLENEYKSILDEWKKNKNISPEKQARWDELDAEIGAARKAGANINDGNYQSSHWDEPNILAHVRMNDRTIDGKKSLHLEEIQSDWHQQGRDQGYKQSKTKDWKISGNDKDGYEIKSEGVPLWEGTTRQAAERQLADMQSRNVTADKGVPDAPFKKSWHELALKRMIREAAEKGYDRLSWTPGEAQAARYDLSKSVDKISVPMVNENGTRSVRIDAKGDTPFKLMVDKEGKVSGAGASSNQFSGKPLSDIVGKEMAEKIMRLDKPNEFSGDNLKIGGEGMKGFYDQIIPKALEKLTGQKVQKGTLPLSPAGKSYESILKDLGYTKDEWNAMTKEQRVAAMDKSKVGQPIHYIDIPQSLKDKAIGKGFPLFSTGGFMFTPVDHDPFKDNK